MHTERIRMFTVVAYENATQKGFHNLPFSDRHYLGLIYTELAEMVEAHRKGKRCYLAASDLDHLIYNTDDEEFKQRFDKFVKDTFEDEIADTYIRVLDLAGLRDCKVVSLEDSYAELVKDANENSVEEMIEDSLKFQARMTAPEFLLNIVSNISPYTEIENSLQDIADLLAIWSQLHHVPLELHINAKLRYNKLRPAMHGKKY